MNCRLCWRVGLVVLASIFVIEAIILIPSVRHYERDLLARLEREGLATVRSLFLMRHDDHDRELLRSAQTLVGETAVKGLDIVRADGRPVGRLGEAPEIAAGAGKAGGVAHHRSADGAYYDVRWPGEVLGAPFVVTARLDSSWIPGELRAFVLRITGLVVLISAFVTAATMLILSHAVLSPVLHLRRNLMAAAADPEHPERYAVEVTRRDELGEVMQAFNRMIHDVARSHRRQMERVAAMSENSLAAILAYDAHGALIYCNKAGQVLCGPPHAGRPGGGDFPRVVPREGADPIPLPAYLTRMASTEEVILETAPGRRIPCLISGNSMADGKGGRPLRYASILEISEMHAYRRRLEAQMIELEAANRAKSEFLAHMSHELRTPLNAILGFSEMMLHETLGPLGSPRYREYARDIHTSGALLLEIIGDILDLSKIEAGKAEPAEEEFSVDHAVRACLRLVEERAKTAGLTLTVERSEPLPGLFADERMFKQILLNLLSNAVKFTPEGGTVAVEIGTGEDEGVRLAVRDTGIGMAPEDIPAALTPFGQVDTSVTRRHAGTGLGLAVVKSLTDLHGGALEIESAVGRGTTVVVTFPAWRVRAPVAEPAPCRAASA